MITKSPIEFMKDEADQATFTKVILEKTPRDTKGLKYKMKERFASGLVGYFDSGLLQFRVQT